MIPNGQLSRAAARGERAGHPVAADRDDHAARRGGGGGQLGGMRETGGLGDLELGAGGGEGGGGGGQQLAGPAAPGGRIDDRG